MHYKMTLLFIHGAILVDNVLVDVASVSMYDAESDNPYKEPDSRNRDANKWPASVLHTA
jgi:hypothetical protein